MQDDKGKMSMVDFKGIVLEDSHKIIHDGECFKIRQCYFKIENINRDGFNAVGITRQEYYNWKRRRGIK